MCKCFFTQFVHDLLAHLLQKPGVGKVQEKSAKKQQKKQNSGF